MPVVELSVAEFAASQRRVHALNARAVRRGWTGRLTLSGERVTVRNEGRPLRFPAYPDGDSVRIAGTVKAHDLWHDQQTMLSRPKRADGGNVA